MRLMYFPVNMRWMFLFGDTIATASIVGLDGFPRGFDLRKEAIAAAKTLGLYVSKSGIVSAMEDEVVK